MNAESVKRLDKRVGDSAPADVPGYGTALLGEETELESMLTRMREGFAGSENVELRVIVEGSPVRLRPSAQREVRLVCQEALANAYQHSYADTIEVEVAYRASELRVIVRDNGVGINSKVLKTDPDRRRGLSLMKQLVESIAGRLRVLSQIGAGTEIEVSIPGPVAFATERGKMSAGWLHRFYVQRTEREVRIST